MNCWRRRPRPSNQHQHQHDYRVPAIVPTAAVVALLVLQFLLIAAPWSRSPDGEVFTPKARTLCATLTATNLSSGSGSGGGGGGGGCLPVFPWGDRGGGVYEDHSVHCQSHTWNVAYDPPACRNSYWLCLVGMVLLFAVWLLEVAAQNCPQTRVRQKQPQAASRTDLLLMLVGSLLSVAGATTWINDCHGRWIPRCGGGRTPPAEASLTVEWHLFLAVSVLFAAGCLARIARRLRA